LEKENQALRIIEDFAKENPESKLGQKAVWDSLREVCREEKISRDRIWKAVEKYKNGERSIQENLQVED